MKITTSDFYDHKECGYDECERRYCHAHRLLWRSCETLIEDVEGDSDVIGGIHTIYFEGDCPKCTEEGRKRLDTVRKNEWLEWSDAQRQAESAATDLAIGYWQEEKKNNAKYY